MINSKYITVFFFSCATFYSMLVLNRWIVTDLGVFSYGRVWPLYISYTDFGFVRRALFGTILTISGMNSFFANEYYFAYIFHHLSLLCLSSFLAFFCISRKCDNWMFIFSIAFSPALIIQTSYSTGTLDIIVLLLATLNILYVRNILLFSAIIVAGVFTHELFLFTIPAQFVALLFSNLTKDKSYRLDKFIIPFIAVIFAMAMITFWGIGEMDKQSVEAIMRNRIPIAEQQHSLWSGYFETHSSVGQNIGWVFDNYTSHVFWNLIYLIIPLSYVGILMLRLTEFSKLKIHYTIIILAAIFPLLAAVVGSDLHRWIGLSANLTILLTLLFASQTKHYDSRWNLILSCFCVFAPFGASVITRPFPLHQFIFEKIL